jgi:UDP-N-acetylmuramyl pentapeptide phosphotransferase/UDP-N-acetylglucosamine-1-phosphate transferase
MFMGDVGSAPIGFLLAVLTLWLAKVVGLWLLVPLALLHANFVLDTAITLGRRVFRGDRWLDAHREHFYQRLNRAGHGHPMITGLEMALQALVLALMVLYLRASPPLRVALSSLVILIWLAFFAFCEWSLRKSDIVPPAGAKLVESPGK